MFNILVIIMQNLKEYNNCLANIPNVIESTFNQIILNFERKIDESLFTSAMSVYLSRINQSEGIVFKIYRNNKEIPLKIEYNENNSFNVYNSFNSGFKLIELILSLILEFFV